MHATRAQRFRRPCGVVWLRRWTGLFAAGALLVAPLAGGCANGPRGPARDRTAVGGALHRDESPPLEDEVAAAARRRAKLAEEWGIEPVRIILSAGGNIVDFRYRVVDAEKAKRVLSRHGVKPQLVHDESGARMYVPSAPKIGGLRSNTQLPKAGRVYFAVFANAQRFIKPGDRVTVELGDCRITDLVVMGATVQ